MFEFWFQIPNLARHAQRLLCTANIALHFTCVYSAAAGNIFGTTDVYELGFSYLSIGIFMARFRLNYQEPINQI